MANEIALPCIGRALPGGIAFFGLLLLFGLVANWIVNDTKHTNNRWICEGGFAPFMAWPVFVPIYLFQTRKMKALKKIRCFMAIGAIFRTLGLIAGMLISAQAPSTRPSFTERLQPLEPTSRSSVWPPCVY